MGGSARLLSSSRTACYGIHADVVSQQSSLSQWQQSQLYAGSETAWVSKVLTLCYLLTMRLRQTIHIVVVALYSKVLRQVYYLHSIRNAMFLEECLALAVSETEEHHIHLVERHLTGKLQFRLAYQALVHIVHLIARIRLRVGEDYLHLWVIHQQSYQFAASVSSST